MHSLVGSRSNFHVEQPNDVVLQGYHKKLKTMKKKYFVLCSETPTRAARLEYYDSEKKFKSRSNPKKTIILKNCFNINQRRDTKYKNVIALSVRDGGFCIVLDTEEELNKWLKALLTLQRGEDAECETPKPTYEHVWQAQVQRKGLAEEKGLLGSYHVCLTSKRLTLYRIGSPKTTQGESRLYSVEFELTTIRRCGVSQCYFYMEVGRHSAIGAGELWMETEDTLIAQNMHQMIINAMSSMRSHDELGPMRKRSSSETSKPTSGIQRRQTTSGIKPLQSSPQTNLYCGRDRCDSLPSRNRTLSECSNQSITNPSMPPPKTIPINNRPHSMYSNRHSNSPPVSAISPSTGCSESEGSSLSIDEPDSLDHSSLTPDESGNFTHYFNALSSRIIPEEKDEMWYSDNKTTSSDTEIPFIDKLNNHGHGGLSLPLLSHQMTRKGSPAMNSHTGSVDMQSQYMDMYSPYSPCGSSPCEQIGTSYMPISPSVEGNRGLYTGSSGGHSRASSLTEETVDGYVPMCPPTQSTQEYVDMEQSIKQNANNRSGFSSAASSSSITSGTPSTDIKFAEYPLEKVTSRFTPDDEDMQSLTDRPARAYSVGSRVEHNKRKLRIDFNNEMQNSRVRAFSVGSRAKVPRCDLSRGVLQSNLLNHMNAANSNTNNNNELMTKNRNNKSSSAPLLLHKNHSSVERMSDLMEIDFSKNSGDSSSSSGSRRNLVDMSSSFLTNSTKNSRITSVPVSVPFASNAVKSLSYSKATPPGYLEMRPGSFPENNCFSSSSPLSLSKFDSSTVGTGSNNSLNHNLNNGNCGYLEMKPVHGSMSKSPSLSSSPSKSILSPKFMATKNLPQAQSQIYPNNSAKEYTSMNNISNNNNNKPSAMQQNIHNDYMNVSPASVEITASSNISTIKENDDILSKATTNDTYSSTPEGYVPMNRNKNLISNDKTTNDNGNQQFWINRSTSMPIDIKNANQQSKHKFSVDLDSSSAIITNQLPASQQLHMHQNDCENSESSFSNNQNTMFSLSPCSPQKTFDLKSKTVSTVMSNTNQGVGNYCNNTKQNNERKCLVDASNGTVTLLDNHDEKISTQANDKPSNTSALSTLSSLQKLHISSQVNSNSCGSENFYGKVEVSNKNIESFLCNYADMSLNIGENRKTSQLNSNDTGKLSFSDEKTANIKSSPTEHDYVNFQPNSSVKQIKQQQKELYEINTNTTKSIVDNTSNKISNSSHFFSDSSNFNPNNPSNNIIKSEKSPPILGFGSTATKRFPIKDKSSMGTFEGFKPINDEMNNNNNNNIQQSNANNNYSQMLKKSSKTTSVTITSTPALKNSAITNQNSNCPAYELLRFDASVPQFQSQQQQQCVNKSSLSRPSSVNSDKISPLKNANSIAGQTRPQSANSECIPSPISNSSSSSTLCGGSSSTSSSSTLCGLSTNCSSKSQSPLAATSSRPQSFTDCTAFNITRMDDSSGSVETLISVAGTLTTTSSSAPITMATGNLITSNSSQNLLTSRPPSVVSEKELHYASLDLPPSSSTTPNPTTQSTSSSSIPETKVTNSSSGDSSTSPSPNASCCLQPAFAYAQIDFNKSTGSSGGLNTNSGSGNSGSSNNICNNVNKNDQKN